MGMNTHIAHPRGFRDIPCSSKDMDLAVDATRVIELSHERMRRRLGNHPRSASTDPSNKRVPTSKESESFVVNFENDKFLMNNPIFMTMWEKIFIKRDGVLPSGKQNFLITGDRDEQRILSKYAFRNGLPYFRGNPE
jgi:hypothetical protein